MRAIFFFVLFWFANIYLLVAQSGYFSNPSFEGPIGQENIPAGWSVCNSSSTPDTQPFDTRLSPTKGLSYLGLVMRGTEVFNSPKNEDVVTKLLKPLQKDSTYILAIDLAIAPTEVDFDTSGALLFYDKIPSLRISGGNLPCTINEIFIVSGHITNTEWKRYYFEITPKLDSCTYLKLEIYSDTLKAAYLLLDNIEIQNRYIRGKNTLCSGIQRVSYSLFPKLSCLSDFKWKYSGFGATINAYSDSITIDFASDAISGTLISTFNNCGKGKDSSMLFVSVEFPPSDTLIINGLSDICISMENIPYHILPVNNALNYVWSYSGTGLSITGSSNNIMLNVSDITTSGNLSVAANTECGLGASSVLFPITISKNLPDEMEIIGPTRVCKNLEQVIYRTFPASETTSYAWSFSGTGIQLTNPSDSILMYVTEYAEEGYLTVTAQNACGFSSEPAKLLVTFDSLPAKAGIIKGETMVCVNKEKIIYSVSPVKYASYYIWNYSGKGGTILGTSDSIELTLSEWATNGILTVKGENQCGSGLVSSSFRVMIDPLPSNAGNISGPGEICSSPKNVAYHVPPIKNASGYIWNYTGTTFTSTSDSIVMNFPDGTYSGNLTVAGVNRCGAGKPSPAFSIIVNNCNQPPPDLNIPNCFSPNGDGINDFFVIRGLKKNARLIILNKYGKILFESADYQNQWDGKDSGGNYVPTDTYWYILILPGYSMDWKGYVYLKR
jgi:gliding motility-associated-like protein